MTGKAAYQAAFSFDFGFKSKFKRLWKTCRELSRYGSGISLWSGYA
jgi:hypothetical protein